MRHGMIKIIGGIGLMLTGIAGFFVGRSRQGLKVRLMIYGASCLCIIGSLWLLKWGIDDYAVGILGQSKLPVKIAYDYKDVVAMNAQTPEELEGRLTLTFRQAKEAGKPIRRLHFLCPDRSQDIRIYNTPVGIYGIPDNDVVCNNGMRLLTYDR